MADNFDLMATALKAVCPNNEILLDNAGKPSVMVRIPKMTYAQLGMGESTALFPAFIINGQEVDEIYISKYLNIVQNGRAYSLPGVDPAASMNFDQARSYCEAKGDGWHCMTRMEWGLLMRICEMQGFIPLGNNNYGKHSSEQFYKAIKTYDDSGKTGRTATGTGPLTWYHDNSPSGIADLVGDVWEWAGGVRTVYGELQVMANNNGADAANSQGTSSTKWMAISADDGSYITPDGSGTTANSVKLDIVSGHIQWSKTIPPATKIPTGRAAALLLSPATARSAMPPSWYCSALVCCRTRPQICALRRVTSAGSATSMPNALSVRAASGTTLPMAWLRSTATARARARGRTLASAPLL